MSAIEWLHFISPLIIVTMIVALIASLPLLASWRHDFQLPKKTLALKKTLIIFIMLAILGWLIAWLAPHIMRPIVRVNLMATSQVIFTLSLIAIAVIVFIRIFQKNNVLSLFFIFLKHYLPFITRIFGTLSAGFLMLFIKSLDDKTFSKQTSNNQNLSDEDKVLYNTKTNYHGEFCDKDKLNWH